MATAVNRSWQDEMRHLVLVRHKAEERILTKTRDDARTRHNIAKKHLPALARQLGADSRKYRQAQHRVWALERQLNQAIDACNTFLEESLAAEQHRLVTIIGQYLVGEPITCRRYPKLVLKRGRETGCLHIYFGGKSKPDGLGHGHWVLLPDGRVAYSRNPGKRHGPQNYRIPQLVVSASEPALQ